MVKYYSKYRYVIKTFNGKDVIFTYQTSTTSIRIINCHKNLPWIAVGWNFRYIRKSADSYFIPVWRTTSIPPLYIKIEIFSVFNLSLFYFLIGINYVDFMVNIYFNLLQLSIWRNFYPYGKIPFLKLIMKMKNFSKLT